MPYLVVRFLLFKSALEMQNSSIRDFHPFRTVLLRTLWNLSSCPFTKYPQSLNYQLTDSLTQLEFTMSDTFMTGHKAQDDRRISSPPEPMPPLPPPSEWLKPGPAYIMPSSGFFFGNGNNPASLIDFLPSRLAADRLIKQYFDCVHPICQILHRPTFEKEYDTFWDEVTLGIEPPNSVQTIVFSAMFSGVVSMDESSIIRDFGVSKSSLIDNFKLGTETALSRANFLRTTKIETLQAFVMYLVSDIQFSNNFAMYRHPVEGERGHVLRCLPFLSNSTGYTIIHLNRPN
jgi:hypothetical protein